SEAGGVAVINPFDSHSKEEPMIDEHSETSGQQHQHTGESGGLSRRDFLKSSVAGVATGAAAASAFTTFDALTKRGEAAGLPGCQDNPNAGPNIPAGQAIVLRGGVVLTLDPGIGDFEQGDVLIRDQTLVDVRRVLG